MTAPRPTLALLDGYSLAYRAFFALPEDLRTTTGQVTNAAYGFTSMVIKLLDEPGLDIARIAELLGYSDAANFTRAFRKQASMTPSAYRATHR